MRDLPSGTVTFLFTDVEGSTRLLHELGPEGCGQALPRPVAELDCPRVGCGVVDLLFETGVAEHVIAPRVEARAAELARRRFVVVDEAAQEPSQDADEAETERRPSEAAAAPQEPTGPPRQTISPDLLRWPSSLRQRRERRPGRLHVENPGVVHVDPADWPGK